mgnify:CR=1 FL=1
MNSFTEEELKLIQTTISSYLLCDWGCQCVEMQKEAEEEKRKVLALNEKIKKLLGE